ncbi:MAG: S8 family serine peptidase [Luteolibacter sp.]
MKNWEKLGYIWLFLCFVCIAAVAYLLTKHSLSDASAKVQTASSTPSSKPFPSQEIPQKHKSDKRVDASHIDAEALNEGAIANQRILVFKDRDALEAFLAKMSGELSLLGRLDNLNALLVGFKSLSDLDGLLDGTEETFFNFPANIPGLPSGSVQDGALALGSGLLKYLGITGDNSLWGTGVKIAVLDTGIADHLVFANSILRINLVDLPSDLSLLNGHGTSVASLIFSNDPRAPGIAPGATPISVRIAGDDGSSNSFLIAQGIIAAVDAGAQLINISLGGYGNSTLVENAVAYAASKNAVIISSSGNTGTAGVLYPAAYPSVIAVGSVDAGNQYLNFSTTGNQVSVSAPGYGITAAYPNDMAARVTGTSFSAPIVTGTIAATMSNTGTKTLGTSSAVKTVTSNLNDVGIQGTDSYTGAGVPDMWRILNSGTSGIYDAAVTSVAVTGNQVQVLVQNQGTETLLNTAVTVNVNGTTTTSNLTTLAAGESRTVTVASGGGEGLNITGSVQVSSGQSDLRPSNNAISVTTPVSSP